MIFVSRWAQRLFALVVAIMYQPRSGMYIVIRFVRVLIGKVLRQGPPWNALNVVHLILVYVMTLQGSFIPKKVGCE